MIDHEAMSRGLKNLLESFPSAAEAAEGLHRLGQIMSGKIQMEEQPAMTTDEIREAKAQLERDIKGLIDQFQRAAGRSVWVAGVDVSHMEQVGAGAPVVIDVDVDVRLR